jgi:hypothetical protein
MTVLLIEAFNDENKKAKGGQAGDQLNNIPGKDEVRIGPWRNRAGGWSVVLECTDVELAKKAVGIFSRIAKDSSFGYDQDQRWTALEAIRNAGGNIEAAADSEIDCSSGIDISYILAGLKVERGYTGNLERRYLATGKFIAHRDPKYLTSGDYAKAGWLYLTAGHHVAMIANDGPKSSISEPVKTETNEIQKIKELPNITAPYIEAIRNVRIRTGPSTKDSSLGYISKGTRVQYLGVQTKNDKRWYQVITSQGKAFVSADPIYTKLVVT